MGDLRGNVLRLSQPLDFVVEECYRCGVPFCMTQATRRYFMEHHDKDFYCPNGHSQRYIGETDAERYARLLREEKERHARTLTRANENAEARQKAENALARQKKRHAHGVCPAPGCGRTFKQLQRHLATKHPEYKA